MEGNTIKPDQTAPKGAVCVCNIGHQSTYAEERADEKIVVNSGKSVNA